MNRYTIPICLAVWLSGIWHVASAQAAETRILFLHHSTGQNLIAEGAVRESLHDLGYAFYDHGYNEEGLRDASGESTGISYEIPDDNTDPDGWAAVFSQPFTSPPQNAFSHMLAYDVIMFKSCFPASNIVDDDQLSQYKAYYLTIKERMDEHPGNLFIILTPPPAIPADSDPEAAARARSFSRWLSSDEYLGGHPNIATFDLFDELAGDDNYLRLEYRTDEYDGHPNHAANAAVGPVLVDFIDRTISGFQPAASETTASSSVQDTEAQEQTTDTVSFPASPTSAGSEAEDTDASARERTILVAAGGAVLTLITIIWIVRRKQKSPLSL
ncbi:MAG TPA: hypothetical protein PKL83_04420 [bacterium]|nr:hypothetical protein [bacterium]